MSTLQSLKGRIEAAVKVGDTLYRFNINRWVRIEDGPAIYAGHFDPFTVTGETKQSWLLDVYRREVRVNKKTLQEAGRSGWHGYQWFTADGMSDDIRRYENRMRIIREVEQADVSTLRAIYSLIAKEHNHGE